MEGGVEPLSSKARGFNLLELMIVVAVIGVLLKIAYPSYKNYIVRTSREAAESQLQQLANLEEKIFLNSSAYTTSGTTVTNVTAAYNGQLTGGLGLTSGQTTDGKYNITATPAATATTFTLQAAPVAGTTQEGDGNVTIDQTGKRLWASPSGTVSW